MSKTFKALAAAAMVVAPGCSSGPTDVMVIEAPAVLNVAPANGATGVDPRGPITLEFSHAMMSGMELLVVLHEVTVTGPTVPSVASWSPDRKSLTLTPSASLKANTIYVIHLAPTLQTSDGTRLNHAACTALGGRTVTGGMMTGGGMGPGMMGSGWQPANGSYGMVFTFTTA